MRIINKKKFYKKDMDAAVALPFKGWDAYNGRNYQWYTVKYNPDCGYVEVNASNSGDCYGDYEDRYYDSPAAFYRDVSRGGYGGRSFSELIGDLDEDNAVAMRFVDEALSGKEEAK